MKTRFIVAFLFMMTLICVYACGRDQKPEIGHGEGSGDGAAGYGTYELSEPSANREEDILVKADWANVDERTLNQSSSVQGTKHAPEQKQKKIIKDGSISVQTEDINVSKKAIDQILKSLNAYYEREDLQNNDQTISYVLKIRVPAGNFERLVNTIEDGKDELKSKNIQSRDVTEEYIDIEARLANKREYLNRYKQLLSRASTVKDVLAIEENIRVIQEEIESREGRLKYLTDQLLFSTLDLTIFQERAFIYKPKVQDKFSERVKTSLNNGWTSIVDFMIWLLKIWPLLIVIVFGYPLLRRIARHRKAGKQKAG